MATEAAPERVIEALIEALIEAGDVDAARRERALALFRRRRPADDAEARVRAHGGNTQAAPRQQKH